MSFAFDRENAIETFIKSEVFLLNSNEIFPEDIYEINLLKREQQSDNYFQFLTILLIKLFRISKVIRGKRKLLNKSKLKNAV